LGHWFWRDKIVWYDQPFKFTREWKNFDTIPAGTPVAIYDDGRILSFDTEFTIIMPKANARQGDELFYMAHTVV